LLDFLLADCGDERLGDGLRSCEEFSAELSLLSLLLFVLLVSLAFSFFAGALGEVATGSLTFLAHFSHSS